jgi:hypothetical protein
MLEPGRRHLYLDALRPPAGYALDKAIGTTFSLDLPTLLTVPLSFALFDHAESREEMLKDPVALLEALRRYADRIRLFTQAGRVAAPAVSHPLYAYLESMVVEANAPDEAGVFHPKCWVLRFVRGDEVRYRFLCLTRNLSADLSWDTVLALDGELTDRTRAFSRNHPLGNFVAALPGLTSKAGELSSFVEPLADEVRRVNFRVPPGFEDELMFHPLGLDGKSSRPLAARRDRMLIVAPFLSEDVLSDLAGSGSVLVSRAESLDEIDPAVLRGFREVYYFDDSASEPEQPEIDGEDDGPEIVRRGLHAKLFVADDGWYANLWTGSANATNNAQYRNVELLVQLRGKKKDIGIDALIGTDEAPNAFRNLLRPYEIPKERSSAHLTTKEMENALEAVRRDLSRAGLALRIERASGKEGHDVTMTGTRPLGPLGGIKARCWLVSLGESHARDLDELLRDGQIRFPDVSMLGLSSFVAFEISLEKPPHVLRRRFALNLPVTGMPEERLGCVLTTIVQDRASLLRYLLLLLEENDAESEAGGAFTESLRGVAWSTLRGPALLEALVRTAARSPERLRRVKELLDDLRASGSGGALLPEELDAIWPPIWAAVEGT